MAKEAAGRLSKMMLCPAKVTSGSGCARWTAQLNDRDSTTAARGRWTLRCPGPAPPPAARRPVRSHMKDSCISHERVATKRS